MKFPRNVRIVRGQLDAAPFAGVLFCLLIFILLCSLVYTPGVVIHLPVANTPMPGIDGPKLNVALFANGTLYYQNQIIQESNLVQVMKDFVAHQSEPVTLVVATDSAVNQQQVAHVRDLGASAGIRMFLEPVMPGIFDEAPKGAKKP